ncbi:DUF389 domain-containing protein [Streptomyces sp. NPDC048419]|uniref:DUF389 domain-containing protein n=1 Tax=Streptomyces sp. NPDC048419 TaxID=3365547 RepID=UPI00371952A9
MAILTNSQILTVAAVVVGLEYGAITTLALGFRPGDQGEYSARAGRTAEGPTLAIAVAYLFSLLIRGFALRPPAFDLGLRPVSHLIDTPDSFSFTVAVLAGLVGIKSLARAKASALLGVFISVTEHVAARVLCCLDRACVASMCDGRARRRWSTPVRNMGARHRRLAQRSAIRCCGRSRQGRVRRRSRCWMASRRLRHAYVPAARPMTPDHDSV